MRKLHAISLEFCKMLQQITRSVTLADHPFFKSPLTSFESLSLLNSRLTQLHLRNKETADPSSLVATPLQQNKNSSLQLPFSITLTFRRKKRMQQLEASHKHHMLWTSGVYPDVCQDIILNQACGERGGQGAVTVYTHPATCRSFLPGLCACKRTPGTAYLCPLAAGNK